MELQCAILCDAASVREGLLHVLGGGINRFSPHAFPSPLGLTLATLLEVGVIDGFDEHCLVVTLHDAGATEISRLEANFALAAPIDIDEVASCPGIIPLSSMWVPSPGYYELRLAIDGTPHRRLALTALPAHAHSEP